MEPVETIQWHLYHNKTIVLKNEFEIVACNDHILWNYVM